MGKKMDCCRSSKKKVVKPTVKLPLEEESVLNEDSMNSVSDFEGGEELDKGSMSSMSDGYDYNSQDGSFEVGESEVDIEVQLMGLPDKTDVEPSPMMKVLINLIFEPKDSQECAKEHCWCRRTDYHETPLVC